MAVLKRDLDMTKLLLECGVDPDGGIWPNRDATSPFVIARDRGYDEIVDAIDTARRKRGARGQSGPTDATRRLQRACQSGSEDAVIAVFNEHPDLVDLCPPDGRTLLHQMAGRGALRVTAWLLDHGANVHRKSEQGWTPLEYAATGRSGDWLFDKAKFERVAGLLLARGRRTRPPVSRGSRPLGISRELHETRVAGEGVLESAVKGNQPDVVRRLLNLGLDPDERTQVGSVAEQAWSAGGPLFQAVILNRIEIARLLLERGADPNANVWTSGSPAYRAYEGRSPEMIALIEQYGGWIDPGSAGYARQTEIAQDARWRHRSSPRAERDRCAPTGTPIRAVCF